jgi:hypothetical protein
MPKPSLKKGSQGKAQLINIYPDFSGKLINYSAVAKNTFYQIQKSNCKIQKHQSVWQSVITD